MNMIGKCIRPVMLFMAGTGSMKIRTTVQACKVYKLGKAMFQRSFVFAVFAAQRVKEEDIESYEESDYEITPKVLIKDACISSVDSVSLLLSHTVVAIVNVHTDYRNAMNTLITLLKQSADRQSIQAQEHTWNSIIATRAEISDLKKSLLELESFVTYVEKLVKNSAQTSFLAGAEDASMSVSGVLHECQQRLSEEKRLTEKVEADLLYSEETHIHMIAAQQG